MLTLLKFLKAAWPYILIAIAILAYSMFIYNIGKDFGKIEVYLKLNPEIESLKQEKLDAADKALRLESEMSLITNDFTQKLSDANAKLDETYQRGLQDGRKKPEAVIAEYAAANKRLSIDLKRAKTRPSCDSTNDSGASSASGSDATERAELSDSAAGFLISEADRADDVVAQLTACQGVAKNYYNELTNLSKKIKSLEIR